MAFLVPLLVLLVADLCEGASTLTQGAPRVAECVIKIIGARQVVSAASVRATSGGPTVREPENSEPSIATIACSPGSDGLVPSLVGGQGLAGFKANFTGVSYDTDESLPGPVLKLTGQKLIIRDSLFSNLVNLAAASLIVISCDLVIRNTTFFSNSQAASGALFLNNSAVTVYDSLFDSNRGYQAGGITAVGSTGLLVNFTVFRHNNGSQGGAIGMSPQGQLNTEARLQVVDSLFLDNAAVNGAGVFVQRAKQADITNSTFSRNAASQNGAAVFQEDTPGSLTFCLLSNNRAQTGGAGYYNRCPSMRWSSNLFRNNSADSGGAGLELNQCTGDVDHCTFHQNQGEKGGGIFMDQCASSVLNCTFTSNAATLLGGALYRSYPPSRSDIRGCSFTNNSAGQFGGAVYEQKIDSGSIEGCRFSGNAAKSGPSLCTRLSATDVAGDNISLDPADIEYMDH